MRLTLRLLNKVRFWAELLSSDGYNVVIPTTERPPIGMTVAVSVEVPDLRAPLTISGTIAGHQAAAERLPAAVIVNLNDDSKKRCHNAFDAMGRAAPKRHQERHRLDCDLPAQLLAPKMVSGCRLKNWSATGGILRVPMALSLGEHLSVEVMLPNGSRVNFSAIVEWSFPELNLYSFHVKFADPEMAQELTDAIVQQAQGRPELFTVPDYAPSIVIAVSDDETERLLTSTLSREGYRAVRVYRGEEIFEAIHRVRPVIVFLDVLMPGVGGVDACRVLRSDVEFDHLPVVLLTTMDFEQGRKTLLDSGASDFLQKPLTPEAIIWTIDRLDPRR